MFLNNSIHADSFQGRDELSIKSHKKIKTAKIAAAFTNDHHENLEFTDQCF